MRVNSLFGLNFLDISHITKLIKKQAHLFFLSHVKKLVIFCYY